jgi:hypothetical protein
MQRLTFQQMPEQPDEQSLRYFPDFLVTTLIREGYGRIDACMASAESEYVACFFRTRRGDVEKQIGEIGHGFFRSILAQLATRCKVDNLYAGHAFFESEQIVNGAPKIHRFSIFLCNENSMGYWFKLYLYGISSSPSPADK